MERRKDNKGRVLKEGESQRKDGRYQYRYTDPLGKRKIIYSKDLHSLRESEEKIKIEISTGTYVTPTNQTMCELIAKYISFRKPSLKTNTIDRVLCFLNVIKKYPIGNMPIGYIKQSDAKTFFKEMYENGYAYGTVGDYKALIKPAFDMAYEDGTIVKNPFDFELSKVIQRKEREKIIISDDQYKRLLDFLLCSKRYNRYYYITVLLYETGLRIGELCGLTIKDVDLKNRKIKITHQLQESDKGIRFIETPKTLKSERTIPISDNAYKVLSIVVQNAIERKTDPIVDGYVGFLFLNRVGNTTTPGKIAGNFRNIIRAYNKKANSDEQLPQITPHTFRHTFCTRLILSGMNIKSVQYIMGHRTINTTLSIYTHIKELDALEDFNSKIGNLPNNEKDSIDWHQFWHQFW